jgi:DNA-binding response OmpR family regulator
MIVGYMKDNGASPAGKTAGAQTRCGTTPSRRILMVDDNTDLRLLGADVLVRSGYKVDSAEDGAAAWDALHANRYDLLITDNNMPKICGVELVKKLRSARMALPVILASGAMTAADLERHPRLQLAATLVKPFTCDELLGTVKKVLSAAESAREQVERPQLSQIRQ